MIDTPYRIWIAGICRAGHGRYSDERRVHDLTFALQATTTSSIRSQEHSAGGHCAARGVRGPNGAASRVAAQHSPAFRPWTPACRDGCDRAVQSGRRQGLSGGDPQPRPVVFLETNALAALTCPSSPISCFRRQARTVRPGKDVTCLILIGSESRGSAETPPRGDRAEVIDLAPCARSKRLPGLESWRDNDGWSRKAGRLCSISRNSDRRRSFDDRDAPVMRVTMRK